MFRRSLPVVKYALVLLTVVLLAAGSQAQEQKVRVKLKGKVKSVAEDRLNIIDAKDMTEIVLQVKLRGRGTDVEVVGTAEPAYLTPGVNVHFLAEMNKLGVVPEPLKEITVCNIDDENNKPICILADPTKPSNKEPGAVNLMDIRGTIKTNKAGKMTIDIPSERTKKSQLVKVTLAPDIKILAKFNDLSMVQEGDDVDVPYGMEIDPVLIIPRKMKITLANPLAPSEKKGPASRKTTTAKSSK